MNLMVIGTRSADGTCRLVYALPHSGEHAIEPKGEWVDGWDRKWDWGCGGVRAVATAFAIFAALGQNLELARRWVPRFVEDWVRVANRSRLAITHDELVEWLKRETAKDLAMLAASGAGQGG